MRTINDYPTQHIRPTPDHIMWIFSGEWCLIDNFAPCPVKIDLGYGERIYETSEHAFAAAKARLPKDHDRIANARGPGAAKNLGRRCPLRPDWEDVKFEVMWRVLIAKFQQNPKAWEVLQRAGKRPIYEGNTWYDAIWGVLELKDGSWKGRNALGQMLVELRDNPALLAKGA